MEKTLNLFSAEHLMVAPEQVAPLVLAYIGDAVYELYIRTYLLGDGRSKVNILHNGAVRFVQAKTQALIMRRLEEQLTEVEAAVVRRGRNAKSLHAPKNADLVDYKYATAFESLIGYLYLKREYDRLAEIFRYAVETVEGGNG
ncbi:MAG TPA: ribonuclease III domain-containing protein [Bacillota bacterium]|nr:ribonuclease III domain-containing protein [Bacillota bacterium]